MKAKVILITSLALMLATAGTTFAANGNGHGARDGSGLGQGNGGVPQYSNCQGTGDADGDGICDLTGNPVGSGYGAGSGEFIDENGDGVCDVGGGTRPQDGSGMRHGGRTR
ncbi:hypothetical protein [Acetobacterium woodii]|uniref:Uncharacterized protein n=1 Tax=Acetobacterium woodii (strain ATCC 29683 / DSM 1030 / JCM 2381 / KCTC 1655 / WB1) TaxID=931626 RepID=H6LGY4_ACEWD|nr:hypothetical protein [Acetobacterium woodii]AFA47122.1 hypothetical protein Awo_c03180 [Acetobacterium woodii DSM 1030]